MRFLKDNLHFEANEKLDQFNIDDYIFIEPILTTYIIIEAIISK